MSDLLKIVYSTYYLSYVINLIGLVENLISFLIFSRKSFQKSSIRFYCKSLAVFDSFVLFNFLCGFDSIFRGYSLIHYSEIVCKAYFFISMGISPIPGWILVVFSIDQVITISMTRRYNFFHKRWFKFLSLATILATHCAIYFQVIFLTNIQKISIANETIEWCDIRSTIMPFIYLIVSVSLPLIFVSITSIYIIRVLIKSRSKVMTIGCGSARRKRDLMFGFNSAILNILFIIFSFPIIVFYLWPIPDLYLSILLKSFGFVFFYSHFTTHFWIYFTVNSIFRHEVLLLFRIRQV